MIDTYELGISGVSEGIFHHMYARQLEDPRPHENASSREKGGQHSHLRHCF
jgi:hypothetical protein